MVLVNIGRFDIKFRIYLGFSSLLVCVSKVALKHCFPPWTKAWSPIHPMASHMWASELLFLIDTVPSLSSLIPIVLAELLHQTNRFKKRSKETVKRIHSIQKSRALLPGNRHCFQNTCSPQTIQVCSLAAARQRVEARRSIIYAYLALYYIKVI